jgi:putative transposase
MAPLVESRHRRSIRLKGYDYAAAGAYFVTIAAQGRACLFGQVVDGEICLNEAGRMVEHQWLTLAGRFPTIDLDEFVVMPNHFHGIILLEPAAYAVDGSDGNRAGTSPAPTEPTAVGATLVVARNVVAPDGIARPNGDRAGTSPAPTEPTAVGATLVVAQNAVAPGGMARSDGKRAGTSPAPTATTRDHADATDAWAGTSPAPTANTADRAPALGAVVGAFKSITTQAYMDGVRQSGWPPFIGRLWQRNYYEHIIRGEKSLDRIREYVASNPQRWAEDRENPAEVDKPISGRRIPQPWET